MTTSEPEEIQPIEGGDALQPHRGTLILILGILGFTCGAIPGILAWIWGKGDLGKMDQGEMDPAGRKPTALGRTLGMISIIWTVVVIGIIFAFFGAVVLGFLGMKNEVASQMTPQTETRPLAENRRLPGPEATGAEKPGEAAAKEGAAKITQLNQPATPPTSAAFPATTTGGMPLGPGGVYGGAKEASRQDPFVSQPAPYIPPPPQPTPVLPAIYNVLGGLRVQATAEKRSTLRRTAGLVWNHDVYGLLEIGGETYIVRPGDKVENYLVSAITRDAIVLYSGELKKYIQVPLQGPGAERPEEQGAAPVTEIGNLPAQARLPGENESGTEPLSPFNEFAPALPEDNSAY
jgi:hypothetical protein